MKKCMITGAMLLLALGMSAREAKTTGMAEDDSLYAEFHDDHIDLSDGRELQFSKSTLPHPGSQLVMTAPMGAKVVIRYPDGVILPVGKVPFVYKVPQELVNLDFQISVDEGGPLLTWMLELKHESGYSLEISPEE